MAKQDNYVKLTLRIPPHLHARLVAVTGAASLNAEIIARLEAPADQRTLRDWFAGQSIAAAQDELRRFNAVYKKGDVTAAQVAEATYKIADAMLAERAKGGAQ